MSNPVPPSPSGQSPEPAGNSPTPGAPPPLSRGLLGRRLVMLVILFVAIAIMLSPNSSVPRSRINYSFFLQQVAAKRVAKVDFVETGLIGTFTADQEPPLDPVQVAEREKQQAEATKAGKPFDEAKYPVKRLQKQFEVVLPRPVLADSAIVKQLEAAGVEVSASEPSEFGNLVAFWIPSLLSMAILGFLLWMLWMRTRDQVGGGSILGNFTRSPARRYESDKQRVMFADVAGLEHVKAELVEIVDFLKSPIKFQRLGGRIPKGTLLMGPPGTGKTMLAKAVAGEAGVPFFSINGSEFIQMFVGVGASRVRDLFRTAKETAPCIVFIDEIDAVGRMRGAGFGGGHDEREQTLNQILSEMDGFSPSESVIVIAATNRPDVLDPALLRPGRFDRHVTVDRPTLKGRRQQFQVHTRTVPLADDVDIDRLARATVGLTGADIRNLVNEAALWATRLGKDKVDMDDFEYARDKVLMGPKREEVLEGKVKSMTAYHEAGHALLGWIVPHADPVHKVTIIPRGRALGVTQYSPEEDDRMTLGQVKINAWMICLLGGRAAEKLVFNEFNSGASNDLQRATDLARRMVSQWGMSERIGPVAFRGGDEHPFLGKEMSEHREYSDNTAQLIDEEVSRVVRTADEQAMALLSQHRDQLEKLTQALLTEEALDEPDIEKLLGPSVNKRKIPLSDDSGSVPTTSSTNGEAGHM